MLNKYSSKIIKFLSNRNLEMVSLTSNNKIFVYYLFTLLKRNNIIYNLQKQKLTETNELRKLIIDNKYIGGEIREYIINTNFEGIKYNYENIEIKVFEPNNSKLININNIITIVKFFIELTNYHKPININIINTNFKKLVPLDSDELTVENINSGSTLVKSFINIWRYEELLKVIIHELIHYLNIDIKDDNVDILNEYIKKKFRIQYDCNINEGYTEALAIFINSIWILVKLNLNINNIEDVLKYEIGHSFYQIIKLKNFYKEEDFFDFCLKIDNHTAIFCYYIIKYFLIKNTNIFLELVKKKIFKKDNNINIIFIDIISKEIIEGSDFLINLSKNDSSLNKKQYLQKNLRMSCWQID